MHRYQEYFNNVFAQISRILTLFMHRYQEYFNTVYVIYCGIQNAQFKFNIKLLWFKQDTSTNSL